MHKRKYVTLNITVVRKEVAYEKHETIVYIPYQCACIVCHLLEMHVYIAETKQSGTCNR